MPAIIIRATKPDAIALDDLFLAFRAPTTLLLDYGGARRSVKKAIVILYHVVQLSRGARACATRKKNFFLNPMRAYKRTTKSWKVFCGSLPSKRYHRFCHFYPFIPKRIPPGRHFSPAYRRNPCSLEFQFRLKIKLICATRDGFQKKNQPPISKGKLARVFRSNHISFCPRIPTLVNKPRLDTSPILRLQSARCLEV